MKRKFFILLLILPLFIFGCEKTEELKVDKEYIVLKEGMSESFKIEGVSNYELIYDDKVIDINEGVISFKKIGRAKVRIKINIFTSADLLTVDCIGFSEGNGTLDNPYSIKTIDDFNNIRHFPEKCYQILNDIDFDNNFFEPIEEFSGYLNGNGHKIKNYSLDGTRKRYVGLFSKAIGANINNLRVDTNLLITMKGFEGSIYGEEFFDSAFGAIVGLSDGTSFDNCLVEGDFEIINAESVGGIVGVSLDEKNDSIIANSTFNGNISTLEARFVGGVAGISSSDIRKVSGYGSIEVADFNRIFVGGVAGKMVGDIEHSFFEGSILINIMSASLILDHKPINPGASYAGLLLGHIDSSMIYECYAIGKITSYGDNEKYIYSRPFIAGGLVGYSEGGIRYTFASCQYELSKLVEDYFTYGALIGKFDGGNDFKHNYYDSDVFTFTSKAEMDLIFDGLNPRKTLELCLEETYTYFDFESIFEVRNGYYPTLKNVGASYN